MRKSLWILLLFFATHTIAQQKVKVNDLLMPAPVSVTQEEGFFKISPDTKIRIASNDRDARRVADFLAEKIRGASGYQTQIVTGDMPGANAIEFKLVKDASAGSEGYKLHVTPGKVTISAQKPAGLFYGMQTLLQLMPKEIEGKDVAKNISWEIPACTITDNPRFGWRGLMLDVSRHFFSKQEVKDFIDEMVKYKFNVLHWHLTDDQGWRIEIKGLPKLTEVGAWNVKKEGYFGTFSQPAADAPRNYGGFYTQDDIREVVKYAQERFVNILPEIDVPGHSLAAVTAYPDLSCTTDPAEVAKFQVNSGQSFMDWSHGAPPIALIDNTLCPANEKVYTFLDQVLTEVAPLFPFEYIHMGGDEAPHNYWEKNPQILALMKKEGLKNMNEVQSYFTRRVMKIVESKGKKLIGWDEILEGGLPKNAAVMSWRGMKGGIEAAKNNHEVVMSPTDFAYLDYMQGDPAIESRVYASLSLKKAYEFDPLPPGVDPKFIKGGQGNLWTEQIYNTRYMQYMLWPRGMAVAEAVWTPMDRRNWHDFATRVEKQLPRMDLANVKYAPSMYESTISVTQNKEGKMQIALNTEISDVDVYYSFDNSFPDNYYEKYTSPLTPPVDAVQLKLVSYKDGKQVGRFITVSIDDLKKRLPKK